MPSRVFSYLHQLGETKIDFEVGRSDKLCALFYKKIPIIIVAGTNGKGSTSLFLENILFRSGYKVGTYMSPHVETVHERIRIHGQMISDEWLEKYGESTQHIIDQSGVAPTYFEFLTFLALHTFESMDLDIGIFEIGLGGRLDSVHSLPRIGAILTPISMDHMNYLGNTLTKIAGEKIPVLEKSPFSVIAQQSDEVESLIQEKLQHTQFKYERRDFFHSGLSENFIYDHGSFQLGPIPLGIRGDHQSSNAALATTLALHLRDSGWDKINSAAIEKGLTETKNAGRLEKWINADHQEIWLDVAHNPDAIEKLVQYFFVRKQRGFHILFGCSDDKPYEQMIESLLPIQKQIHFVTTPTPRSWKPSNLILGNPVSTLEDLIRKQNFPILCTGSFYHVGDIRKKLPSLSFFKQ